jgi:hypothetical protein
MLTAQPYYPSHHRTGSDVAKVDPELECIAFAVWLDGWQEDTRLNFDQAKKIRREEVRFTYRTARRIRAALRDAGYLKS